MEKNEIKKALYKEKPTAKYIMSGKEVLGGRITHKAYKTDTTLGTHIFTVPVSEMGEKPFEDELPAQLLIRWLI